MPSLKMTFVMSAAALSCTLDGCMFLHMQRDPNTAQVFPPTLSQMESGVRMNESNIDGLDSDFQGSLAGTTPKVKADPGYLSMMGKYGAAKKRYDDDKTKWAQLDAWAQSVKSDPIKEDLDRLRSEGAAIDTDLRNIGVTLRLLPGELTRIQNTQQWKNVSSR